MGNPLIKRFPRELRNNLGKYLGLFFMMVFATAFTSGFLLAASSIETICRQMPETYAVEDGRFACDFEPSEEALAAVEDLGLAVVPDFYREVRLDLGSAGDGASGITARVYPPRTEVNLPVYAQGHAPEAADEVALDRVFMVENHGLALGDTIRIDGKPFTICGVVTFVDYQALFADNSSFMFDALTFCVATMTAEGYRSLDAGAEIYNYAFTFKDRSLDLAARTEIEEDMLEALSDADAVVSNFMDAEDNQGIGYALDDVQGDQTMWTVLLLVLIVIMAFVFVVLTGATIEAESSVIGTMLASGWRKREIVAHYLVLPTLVGVLGAAVGLAIGVNLLADPMKNLYYHSYSLPPYHTVWNWRVVFITAIVPVLLLVGITLFGLARKMRFTPLQFLRHEVSSRKRNASVSLPDGLSYPARFRLRVLLRNASHFATLFFGIMFASLLLLFGTCMLPVVQNYAGALMDTVKAPHQYVLKVPLELEGTDSEREMYAAALRVVEDKDRYEANRDAIDAANRLSDNEDLMDALERLQDNDALMDAFDLLQDNDALMDAIDRLSDNEELMDALERLQDNEPLMDALDLLQDNEELMDALERLQDNDELMDALERLQDNEPLMDAFDRLQNNEELMDALNRLQDNQALMDALNRLQERQDVLDALERLQNNQALLDAAGRLQSQMELMYWVQWAQANPNYVAAATRVAAGSTDPADLSLAAQLTAEEQAGLKMVANMDAQTRADMELLQNADSQTQADLELVQNLDSQTQADVELLQGLDDATRADVELLQDVDDATQADIDLLQDVDEQTQADIDLLRDLDDTTQADIDLLRDVDDATQDAIDVLRDVDDATQADIDLLRDLDDATQADVDLLRDVDDATQDAIDVLRDVDDATQADIDLLRDVDDATQADIDLVRAMDESLLDDVRLAADIDEDAHVVNTRANGPDAIAQAEKYALGSIEIERLFGGKMESVSVYGIQPDSRYWTDIPVADGHVVAGRGLIEKTKAEVGAAVQAYNRRAGEDYQIEIAETASNEADTNLYMTLADFNKLFDEDSDYFNAYASKQTLELDGRYTAQHVQPEDMLKISDQLETSMGKVMYMMMAMAVPIYLILVYLLTKTVIDRSARSISYMKVFGYHSKEVNGLYIRPITYWVLFSLVASLPLIVALLLGLLKVVFMDYAGNFAIIIPPERFVVLVVVGMLAYAIVAVMHVRRIKRVPLELAMKVQE